MFADNIFIVLKKLNSGTIAAMALLLISTVFWYGWAGGSGVNFWDKWKRHSSWNFFHHKILCGYSENYENAVVENISNLFSAVASL